MIKGITVTLLQFSTAGEEPWTPVLVNNVLVAPVSEVDSAQGLLPAGHGAVYHLAIPKGDTHAWEGQLVQFFGCTWAVVGIPTRGIDDLIPGPWNMKVTVELYRTGAPDPAALWADTVTFLTPSGAKDAAGYDVPGPPAERQATAIFTEGVNVEAYAADQKAGLRRSATVELWIGDYQGERQLVHNSVLYEVRESQVTGRGTLLLKIQEVWR